MVGKLGPIIPLPPVMVSGEIRYWCGPSGDFIFFIFPTLLVEIGSIASYVKKSTDNGNSWNDGSYTGLNGTKAQDKQWSIIDRHHRNHLPYLDSIWQLW